MEKNNVSFASGFPLEIASELGVGHASTSLCFQTPSDTDLCMLLQTLRVHMWAIHVDLETLSSLCPLSPLALNSSALLPWSSLSLEGKDLIETSHSGLSVPRFLTYYITFACGSHLCPHLQQGEVSMRMTE